MKVMAINSNVVPNKTKILVVDDDPVIVSVMSGYLQKNGFLTIEAQNAAGGIELIKNEQPDAVVLDALLPDGDGFDMCRQLREYYFQPIILLTGRTEDVDEVLGLELGADDYIAKPADPRVVLARIKACLRRQQSVKVVPEENPEQIKYGAFSVDRTSRSVTLGGQDVVLTDAEFELLWLLANNAGSILSREQIYGELRGLEYDGIDRSIDMRVSRLRRQLGDDTLNPKRIKTIRSKGYLFSRTDW